MSKRIDDIIEELIDQYLEKDRYNRPWIIGFSGGKDSTVLLTLVWLALQKIREEKIATLKRQIYVVCNDTMVENPVIEENRNVSKNRSETRRNGQRAVDETGHNQGNYTMEYRIQLLRELLTIQKDTQQYRSSIDLITSQELIAIQVMWYRDGNFTTTVNDIYNEVYGYDLQNDNYRLVA